MDNIPYIKTINRIFVMKVVDRLLEYVEYKGERITSFEVRIGFTPGYIKKMKDRNSDFGESKILCVLANCPEVSMKWLLFGEGEMLSKTDSISTNTDEISYLRKKNEEKEAIINSLNQEIGMLKSQLGNLNIYAHLEEGAECADVEKQKQVG